MDHKKLGQLVAAEHSQAMGSPGGTLAQERRRALDRYLRQPMGNEEEGSSQAVTSDVADVVDSMMPSMLRIFASNENLLVFDPEGPEDEPLAEQETDVVYHKFTKDNDAFIVQWTWMFDAFLQKVGVVMAYPDETESVTEETYERLFDFQLSELVADPEVEILSSDEMTMNTETPTEDGQVIPAGTTVFTVRIRRKKKQNKLCVDNVPPEHFRISSDANSVMPHAARMKAVERPITRSELTRMGFDPRQVKELDATKSESTEAISRRTQSDEHRGRGTSDKSQEEVLVRWSFIYADYDDDGVAELREVWSVGSQILKWKDRKKGTNGYAHEVVDRHPFHFLCPYPLPHKWAGQSVDDKIGENQDISTTLLRQTLDNLYHTNNPQKVVWNDAMGPDTWDDLLSTRLGANIRVDRPVGEAMTTITTPFTAQATFPMLEYFDRVSRQRTGVGADGEGLNMEALKNIQTSVLADAVDLNKMKIEAVARVFAETGYKSLFLHLHQLLRQNQDTALTVKLRNRWISVDPSSWHDRTDMTVKVGIGLGTKESTRRDVQELLQLQGQVIEAGGQNLIVKPQNVYQALSKYVKATGLGEPEQFFSDPGEELAPPPNDEMMQMQKQQQELQAKEQQLTQMKQQIEQGKLQIKAADDQAKHRTEMARLQEQQADREEKYRIATEKLENDLADLRAKYARKDEELEMQRRELDAKLERMAAETQKIREETEAQKLETDAVESGIMEMLNGPSFGSS